MGSNDPIKLNEFVPPPSDDRDALICIVVAGAFLAVVVTAIVSIF